MRKGKLPANLQLASWKDEFGETTLLTDNRGLMKLYLDGGLQFTENEEKRYHQILFLLPSLMVREKDMSVLVLGGGDGLGIRELVAQENIKDVTLVDISNFMITLATHHPEMKRLNENSFHNKKVTTVIQDSKDFIINAHRENKKYDLIVLDYPDPNTEEDNPINALFEVEHLKEVKALLKKDGILSMQSTAVAISPNVFRKIQQNFMECFDGILPLRVPIESFLDVGIILAKDTGKEWELFESFPDRMFCTEDSLVALTTFHKDELPTLDDDVIKSLSISELTRIDVFNDLEEMYEK